MRSGFTPPEFPPRVAPPRKDMANFVVWTVKTMAERVQTLCKASKSAINPCLQKIRSRRGMSSALTCSYPSARHPTSCGAFYLTGRPRFSSLTWRKALLCRFIGAVLWITCLLRSLHSRFHRFRYPQLRERAKKQTPLFSSLGPLWSVAPMAILNCVNGPALKARLKLLRHG